MFRIKKKKALTAEDNALPAQLVKMVLKIKEKVVLTAEDHVLHVQLVVMVSKTKEKQALIVVRLVQQPVQV